MTEPVACSNTTVPAYSVLDCRVGPSDSVALVRVRRDGPTNYSFAMTMQIAWSAAAVVPTQATEFVFDFDVDEITIPVPLVPGKLAAGQSIAVSLVGLRSYNTMPTLAKPTGVISLSAPVAPPLAAGQVSRAWNASIARPVNPVWPMDFYSNLVTGAEITATGFDAAGKPCFKNSLAGGTGRAQFTNAEVGLYSDPATDKTNPFQTYAGQRLLCPEKLPAPIVATSGPYTKTCTYSSPTITTETCALLAYGRFEFRFALRHPQPGMWPAGWMICLPASRWPACEIDAVEINCNGADPEEAWPFTTNHWPGAAGAAQEGQFANVFDLLPDFSYADMHSYWAEWTPERIVWGIDNTLVFSAPNRFFMADRTNPNDPNRLMMMLQIALGGAGGDCSKGAYPVAPSQGRGPALHAGRSYRALRGAALIQHQ